MSTDSQNIKVLAEFRDLIPPLSEEELGALHASLAVEGCLSPLVVWKGEGVLLDGHNRMEYCTANNIAFQITEIVLADHTAAREFIILHQLGRRNVSAEVAALLRGKLYLSKRKTITNPDGIGGKSGKIDDGQNVRQQTTAEAVASQTGVNEKTVRRDAAFAEAVETLGVEREVMSGKAKRLKDTITKAANILPSLSTEKQEEVRKGGIAEVAKLVEIVPAQQCPSPNGAELAKEAIAQLEKIRACGFEGGYEGKRFFNAIADVYRVNFPRVLVFDSILGLVHHFKPGSDYDVSGLKILIKKAEAAITEFEELKKPKRRRL